MIQAISSNITKYPTFKNKNKNKTDYCVIGQKDALSIDSTLDFQRKVIEQNERIITLFGLLTLTAMLGSFLYNMKAVRELYGVGGNKQMKAVFKKFESLKNDSKIPTIDNCKSINNDLKNLLQRQIHLTKLSNNTLEKSGSPKANNRLILYGPAGVGKSYFSKIYAKSLDADYMEILYSDFNSMWAGEGVDNLKKIFEKIIKEGEKHKDKKFVVTFNEIDAIIQPVEKYTETTKGTHWLSKMEERSVFLNYLEVLNEKVPNITVIGTTNLSPQKGKLDAAAISRFYNAIEVPYPDENCLFEALKMNLSKQFNSNEEKELKEIAKEMANRKFSFRNLEYVLNEAKVLHLEDLASGKQDSFDLKYLKQAKDLLKLSDGEINSNIEKLT